MKKKLMMSLLLISVFVMTGCGAEEKVLECTNESDQGFMTMVENEKVVFKGESVIEYSEDVDIVVNELYMDYKDDYIAILKEEFAKFENMKGVTFTMNETDEGLKVSLKAVIADVEDENLDDLQLARTASYDETLKLRNENGYTCK